MITIILEMLVRFQPDSLKYCFNMDNGYVEIIDTTHHRAEVYFDKEGIAYCKPVEVKYRSCCGKDLCHDTEGSLCFDCNNKKRREDMLSKYGDITKDKLFEMLKNESFLSVGKKLGVSDNMVRKICDIFGIPRHASYYRKLKD